MPLSTTIEFSECRSFGLSETVLLHIEHVYHTMTKAICRLKK